MSKATNLHRLNPKTGSGRQTVSDAMSALIEEAHRQNKLIGSDASGNRSVPAQASAVVGQGSSRSDSMLPEKLYALLRETIPTRRLADLVLEKETVKEIKELIGEVRQTALLRAHSLEPRHTVMLIGPPGTGKTSMAEALATELSIPLFTVRYDGLVGSYLGETASRLQDVVDYASRMPCVLFFDEFDSVGKERADANETGEIKRVVSSLLLNMDAIPSQCIVVCATNHPELLDRAVWRRFELRLNLPRPGAPELKEWFARTEKNFGRLGLQVQEFVALFLGENFSEIEGVTLDARRKVVLSGGEMTPSEAFKEALTRWERRRGVGEGVESGRVNSTNRAQPRKSAKKAVKRKSDPSTPDLLGNTGE